MQYKAIIFDLDGTVVPSVLEGMPSQEVIDAVKNLHGKIKFSSASGRSVFTCRDIWKALGLTDPCVINGGSQIVDPVTEKILWEQQLPDGAIKKIVELTKAYSEKYAINGVMFESTTDLVKFPQQANIVVAFAVKKEHGEKVAQILSAIPDIVVHILHSWMPGDYWDIHVTHKEATKKHAIEELIKLLGFSKEEVIGIGDGNNDVPLFESVGKKIAMGNAVDTLKAKADYVTDTLENDGFAKFLKTLSI